MAAISCDEPVPGSPSLDKPRLFTARWRRDRDKASRRCAKGIIYSSHGAKGERHIEKLQEKVQCHRGQTQFGQSASSC